MVRKRCASERLRCCTQCDPNGKLRDRDIQASRNILIVTLCLYFGLERPEDLQRRRGTPPPQGGEG